VLTSTVADRAHRAFSNLFVQTEFEPGLEALVAGRRPRSPAEAPVWAAHLAVVEGTTVGDCEFETDRAAFIGRDQSIVHPHAMTGRGALGGGTGTVLDPIFSLRRRVRVAPGGTARITFWTAIANSRAEVLRTAEKCRDAALVRACFDACLDKCACSAASPGRRSR
jgi:cyclic beta-1,2-glucan synthetase